MNLWLPRILASVLGVAAFMGGVALLGCATSEVSAPTTAAVSLPDPSERRAALRLDLVRLDDKGELVPGVCSGHAVDTHMFITASHCLLTSDTRLVALTPFGREPAQVEILHMVASDTDQVFVLTDYTFEDYAPLVRMDPTLPYQGEKVHYWGNPLGLADQYREGYITGHCDLSYCFPGLGGLMAEDTKVALMSVMGQRGDSGAALLNEHGAIVGIVSLIQDRLPPPFIPLAVIEFSFTDEDLAMLAILNDWKPPSPAAQYVAGE